MSEWFQNNISDTTPRQSNMNACVTLSPPLPRQFRRDLRAALTLHGLANPSLEGVRLAR